MDESSPAEIQALMRYASVATHARYTQIYRRGGALTACCVLLQGSARLSGANAVTVGVLREGDVCGGGAWLEGVLQTETATALTPCVMLTINALEARRDHRLIHVTARLADALGEAWVVEQLNRHASPLLRGLMKSSVRRLAPLFKPRVVAPDTDLVSQGEPGEYMYLLLIGEVRVMRRSVDGDRCAHATSDPFAASLVEVGQLTDTSAAPYAGELGLVFGQPQPATIRSVEKCLLLELHARHVPTFVDAVPGVVERARVRWSEMAVGTAVGWPQSSALGIAAARYPSSPPVAPRSATTTVAAAAVTGIASISVSCGSAGGVNEQVANGRALSLPPPRAPGTESLAGWMDAMRQSEQPAAATAASRMPKQPPIIVARWSPRQLANNSRHDHEAAQETT